MIRAILFDLDGTLLPMDLDEYNRAYFTLLGEVFAQKGYDPEKLIPGVWQGIRAMTANDGSRTNEEAFWEEFSRIFGERVFADRYAFDEFYANEFESVREVCGYDERIPALLQRLKRKGYLLALASNPVYPLIAHLVSARWAGVDHKCFEYISSYENSTFCKPHPGYYMEMAERLGCEPQECLMVGNDVRDDMSAREAGMAVFLLTDCLINTEGRDISGYPNGGYAELARFIDEMERG